MYVTLDDGQELELQGRIGRLVRWLIAQRGPLTQAKSCQLQVDMQGGEVEVRVTTFTGRLQGSE